MNTKIYIIIALIVLMASIGAGIYFFLMKNNDGTLAGSVEFDRDQNNMAGVAPAASSDSSRQVLAVMKTNFGDIKLELFKKDAPLTVDNFVSLSKAGFYNGTKFHRVIKDFMIQGGDPNSKDNNWADDGRGGPGYSFKDEINEHKLVKGALAMANAGPNTNGSQFFIVTATSTPWLDGHHTVFGQVIEGIDVVLKIENVTVDKLRGDHPTKDVIVNSIEISEK